MLINLRNKKDREAGQQGHRAEQLRQHYFLAVPPKMRKHAADVDHSARNSYYQFDWFLSYIQLKIQIYK